MIYFHHFFLKKGKKFLPFDSLQTRKNSLNLILPLLSFNFGTISFSIIINKSKKIEPYVPDILGETILRKISSASAVYDDGFVILKKKREGK